MVRRAGKDLCWTGGRWQGERLYIPHVLTELKILAGGGRSGKQTLMLG